MHLEGEWNCHAKKMGKVQTLRNMMPGLSNSMPPVNQVLGKAIELLKQYKDHQKGRRSWGVCAMYIYLVVFVIVMCTHFAGEASPRPSTSQEARTVTDVAARVAVAVEKSSGSWLESFASEYSFEMLLDFLAGI